MKKMNYKFIALALVSAFAFTACEEGDLTSTGEVEAAMGELYVQAEGTASQLFKNVDEAMRKLENNDPLPYTIDNATFQAGANAGEYELDYGNGTNTRGKVIKGLVKVTVSGASYLTPGANVGVTYDNYFEDDKPLSGGISITNSSDATTTSFDLDINALSVEDNTPTEDGGPKPLVLSSEKTLTWVAGSSTVNDITDDVYTIADLAGGNGTSATYGGQDYGMTIAFTSPLEIDNSCQYRLTQGVIDLTLTTTVDPSPLTFDRATIDFIDTDGSDDGNGGKDGCDKFFTIDLENTSSGAKVTDLTRQFNGF